MSWQTGIAHKLPYGYTQCADLTMRAPDASVPTMLLEADCVNEPARRPGGQAAPAHRVVRAPGAEDDLQAPPAPDGQLDVEEAATALGILAPTARRVFKAVTTELRNV